jgi:hypothetical protein
MEKKNNMQSFERIREVLEKYKAIELVKETVSPLSSTSVSSGYIVLTQYQSGSCNGAPVANSGTVLGVCIAVNSGYSGLPYGCSSSGSYVKLTSSYDSTKVYLTYSYYTSSSCSSSCGSDTYEYTKGCTANSYSYGIYQSFSFSSSMVLPSAAGTLTQEYVSSSCSGTLTGYSFLSSICIIDSSTVSYEVTCSSDTNTQQYDIYYNTDCSGTSYSSTYDLSYTCATNPYAIASDNNSDISKDSSYYYYYYYNYYSVDSLEATFYKETCKSASSSSSSSSKLSQGGVIAVSVVSVIVFLLIVGLVVFLFFNYCYKHKNASNINNGHNNNTDNFTSAVEIVDVSNQKV